MKSENSIVNLFKEGFNNYTVSVKSKELAFIKKSINRKSFFKFSLIKLNIHYVSAIALVIAFGGNDMLNNNLNLNYTVKDTYTHRMLY